MRLRPAFLGAETVLKALPWLLLVAVWLGFGSYSVRFLSVGNLAAIVSQSSWLMVVALGMNFVLLASGVDLSVGAGMYLAAIVVGTMLSTLSWWSSLLIAILIGCLVGALNGFLIVSFSLPSFIVTLASAFIARGAGLYLSSTKVVFATETVAALGRSKVLGVSVSVLFALVAVCAASFLLKATNLGLYIRSIGADAEGARRAGVPINLATWTAFTVCGGFAGFGGFILLSQTSAASAAFGQNAEFLAIAAAVLGGTSLFGGRGRLSAPILGAVLITSVQNGLVVINANPYAYPVIVGAVIFLAALIDSGRSWLSWLAKRSTKRESMPNPGGHTTASLFDDIAHH